MDKLSLHMFSIKQTWLYTLVKLPECQPTDFTKVINEIFYDGYEITKVKVELQPY